MEWIGGLRQRVIFTQVYKVCIGNGGARYARSAKGKVKMKTMSMKSWEKSAMDKKMDKKLAKKGIKEGSKKEQAMDRKAMAAYAKAKKK